MRLFRLALVLLLIFPITAAAQTLSNDTCVSFTDTGCASFRVAGSGSVGIQITGTWSGTITFQGSIDNTNFVTIQVLPAASATPVTTTTSNGVWTSSIAGLTSVRAKMTTYTSGDAVVVFRAASSAKNRGGSSGGGGSGDALTTDPLSQFASTTSDQLAGVISNETGSGTLLFGDQAVRTTDDVTFDALTVTSCTGCGSGGAPTDATYITATSNGTLSAERVATNSTSNTFNVGVAGQLAVERAALTGDVTASANSNSTTIANDAVTTAKILNDNVTDAKLRDSAALSVIGRSANSSANPADIAAANDGEVLRRSGTSLGFGALDLASANAVTGSLPIANQVSQSGRLIGVQVITATGACTYTPTSGTASVIIYIQGGGAGGSGADGGSGTIAIGQGGGAGATNITRLTSAFSGAGCVVGAKGTGGIAANGTGNNGSSSTFTATGGGTVYTAAGGVGGSAGGPSTNFIRNGGAGGNGLGGASTNGNIANLSGGSSGISIALAVYAIGGDGGSSFFGSGPAGPGVAAANSCVVGNNAVSKGTGGSGSVCNGTATATAGGDGADGVIVIYEYS